MVWLPLAALKTTVPEPPSNVPAFVQLPLNVNVEEPRERVVPALIEELKGCRE